MTEYAKMDPKMKRRWIRALRSGKYKQGHDRLRTEDNRFCCLGVVCDIVNPDGWRGGRHSGSKVLLGKRLAKKLGIASWIEKNL